MKLIKFVFVYVVAIAVMQVFAAKVAPKVDSVDVFLMSPEDYQEQVIRKPLLLKRLQEIKGKESVIQLGYAAIAFDSAQYEKALKIYKANRLALPELEGSVLKQMALCYIQLHQLDSARAMLLSDASIVKNRVWWESIDRLLIEILVQDSALAPTAKIDSLERRKKGNPSESYQSLLDFRLAILYQSVGNETKALSIWESLLNNRAYKETAIEQLSKRSVYKYKTPILSSLATAICKTERYVMCIEVVDSLLQRIQLEQEKSPVSKAKSQVKKSNEQVVNLLALKAQAYRSSNKNNEAMYLYKWLLDSVEIRPVWMQALIRLERQFGVKERANSLDSIFRDKYPFSPENANNLWVKALEFEQEKKYDSASVYYGRLADVRFGNNQKHQWAPFRMGLVHYSQGQNTRAIEVWDSVKIKQPSIMAESAVLFFKGEAYLKLSDSTQAKKAFIEVHEHFPLSWYAHRARQRLIEAKLLDPLAIPKIKVFETTDSGALEWLRARQPKNRRDEIEVAEKLNQIELLFLIGFTAEAKSILAKTNAIYAKRADYFYLLGKLYERIGNYGESYRMARLFLELVDRRAFKEAPRQIAEFTYPMPLIWKNAVEPYITPPVDLFFLFAVMRQESIFIPTITSPVGARGLMQFMPQTGRTVAKQEGIAGYRDDLLYNPVMSMRLGNRYLSDLLNEYGSAVYALANYNAGPGPAKRWKLAHIGLSYEEQVESISFWETRDYVKKVMGNYWTYQAIYGKQ